MTTSLARGRKTISHWYLSLVPKFKLFQNLSCFPGIFLIYRTHKLYGPLLSYRFLKIIKSCKKLEFQVPGICTNLKMLTMTTSLVRGRKTINHWYLSLVPKFKLFP